VKLDFSESAIIEGTRPVAQIEQLPAAAVPQGSSEAVDWLRRNSVALAAVALIAAQLWWKAHLLAHFYFRQDDFQVMDHALGSALSLKFLFTIDGGHLMPAGLAIAWASVRLSLYDWTLASIVTMVLLAATSFAMLRVLWLIFGKRTAILIPLAIFLFSPLTLPGLSFWTTTLLWLPLQLTILMAIGSHIRYLRSGRLRHVIAAAAWLAAGMLVDEPGILVPFLVFALTSAYFVPGRWLPAARQALRAYRRAWVIYGGLTVAYLIVFVVALQTSVQQPGKPGLFSGVVALASTMFRVTFASAAFGGPWRWYAPGGDYGYAVEAAPLTQIAWVLAILVIGVSLWYRRHALRAWLILACWLLLADLGPVVLSRVSAISATILGLDLHYLADAAPILALCVGLAFWPVIGEERPYRGALPPLRLLAPVSCVVVGCILASSIWSGTRYLEQTSSTTSQSYIATARLALAKAEPGTVILSGATPQNVMYNGYIGAAAQTSRVLGPLAPHASKISFTTEPEGIISNLMVFDTLGRLLPAVDIGADSVHPPAKRGCWPIGADTTIPLANSVFDYGWIVLLHYSGPATSAQLQLGRDVREVTLPAGTHDVYVPVTGTGHAIQLRSLGAGPAACVSSLTVGLLYPSKTAYPLPFYPVP
jgi:hypothetical protein